MQGENSRRNCQEGTKRTGETAKCLPNKWDIRPTRRKAGLSSERKARAVRSWEALTLGSLNMQFQHDWPKDKNILQVP